MVVPAQRSRGQSRRCESVGISARATHSPQPSTQQVLCFYCLSTCRSQIVNAPQSARRGLSRLLVVLPVAAAAKGSGTKVRKLMQDLLLFCRRECGRASLASLPMHQHMRTSHRHGEPSRRTVAPLALSLGARAGM